MTRFVPAAIELFEALVMISQVLVIPGFQNASVAATTLVKSMLKVDTLLTLRVPPSTRGIEKLRPGSETELEKSVHW